MAVDRCKIKDLVEIDKALLELKKNYESKLDEFNIEFKIQFPRMIQSLMILGIAQETKSNFIVDIIKIRNMITEIVNKLKVKD